MFWFLFYEFFCKLFACYDEQGLGCFGFFFNGLLWQTVGLFCSINIEGGDLLDQVEYCGQG